MYLGKLRPLIFKLSMVSFFSLALLANDARAQANTEKVKRKAARTLSSFEVGASYQMFNEKIEVSKAGDRSEGYSSFAGFSLGLEQSWARNRWVYGGSLAYVFGKASSGGFNTAVSFPDGINRSWWAGQTSFFGLYRLNPTFSIGLGLFARYREADWLPQDRDLTVKQMSNTQGSGSLILRWSVERKLTLIQSFTPLDFSGSTMWQWTAQIPL